MVLARRIRQIAIASAFSCIIPTVGSAEKAVMAVFTFEAQGVEASTALVVTDLLRSALIRTGACTVVERSQIDRLLGEHALHEAGCNDPNCAIRVGRLLGATKALLGTVNKLGNTYIIIAKVVDVASQEALESRQIKCIDCRLDDLHLKIDELAKSIVGQVEAQAVITQTGSAPQATAPAPAPPAAPPVLDVSNSEELWRAAMKHNKGRGKKALWTGVVLAGGGVALVASGTPHQSTFCDSFGCFEEETTDTAHEVRFGTGILVSLSAPVPLIAGLVKRSRGNAEVRRLEAIGRERGWVYKRSAESSGRAIGQKK